MRFLGSGLGFNVHEDVREQGWAEETLILQCNCNRGFSQSPQETLEEVIPLIFQLRLGGE